MANTEPVKPTEAELRARVRSMKDVAEVLMETAKAQAASPDDTERRMSICVSMCVTVLCGTIAGRDPEQLMEQFAAMVSAGAAADVLADLG